MLTLLPDMNIAALKYKFVLKEHGGPIRSVSFLQREGQGFEGFAELDEKIGAEKAKCWAATKADAVNGAISETLLSWALREARRDPACAREMGLDLEFSEMGFAAFPGLGVQGAKKRALFDAARSWTVASWLGGAHPHFLLNLVGFSGILVKGPIKGMVVVVLWREKAGRTAYASAAGTTEALAVEAAKNRLFLAEEEQKASWQQRVRERLTKQGTFGLAPALAVDASLRGPWTQYTHVWRCLFDSFPKSEKDKGDSYLF